MFDGGSPRASPRVHARLRRLQAPGSESSLRHGGRPESAPPPLPHAPGVRVGARQPCVGGATPGPATGLRVPRAGMRVHGVARPGPGPSQPWAVAAALLTTAERRRAAESEPAVHRDRRDGSARSPSPFAAPHARRPQTGGATSRRRLGSARPRGTWP